MKRVFYYKKGYVFEADEDCINFIFDKMQDLTNNSISLQQNVKVTVIIEKQK